MAGDWREFMPFPKCNFIECTHQFSCVLDQNPFDLLPWAQAQWSLSNSYVTCNKENHQVGVFAGDIHRLFKNYSVQIKKRHNPRGHVHTKLTLKYQIFVPKLFRKKNQNYLECQEKRIFIPPQFRKRQMEHV